MAKTNPPNADFASLLKIFGIGLIGVAQTYGDGAHYSTSQSNSPARDSLRFLSNFNFSNTSLSGAQALEIKDLTKSSSVDLFRDSSKKDNVYRLLAESKTKQPNQTFVGNKNSSANSTQNASPPSGNFSNFSNISDPFVNRTISSEALAGIAGGTVGGMVILCALGYCLLSKIFSKPSNSNSRPQLTINQDSSLEAGQNEQTQTTINVDLGNAVLGSNTTILDIELRRVPSLSSWGSFKRVESIAPSKNSANQNLDGEESPSTSTRSREAVIISTKPNPGIVYNL